LYKKLANPDGNGGGRLNLAILPEKNREDFDKPNALIAALVFIITFIVYLKTMAPTFSFWDCGEFVACSYILGIPHPPGSPLYILIGRIFTLIPLAADIAARTNFLSVVSSALASTFIYLILVRVIRFWFDDARDIYNRVIAYIGGFTGALFVAFSATNWANSVESEVYAPTMLLMLAVYWLTLKFFSNNGKLSGSRAMLLAFYLAVLGVGIHLTIFAIIPVIGLYFIFRNGVSNRHWMAVSIFFLLELYFIFRLSSRPDEIPFYIPVLIIFIIFLFHLLQFGRIARSALISIGLFVVSLYPFYFILFDNLLKRLGGSGLSSSIKSLANLQIGWIGVVGLAIWGIYLFIRKFSKSSRNLSDIDAVVIALYSTAPIILIGMGEFFGAFDPYSSFKTLTAIMIIILIVFMWRNVNWSIAVALGGISMIMLGFWEFVAGLSIGAAIIVAMGIFLKDRSWKTALSIIFLAVIAYSIHGYIPIRSARNPSIDENKPSSSLKAMVGYLERKQYGSESMSSRMFERRGEWENQFGDFRRLGFWRFFKEQYGFNGSKFFIAFILGLFGLWETIRRKPSIGLPLLVMTIISTLGIVLYMNFADGTRQSALNAGDYIEVRDRDYFYTAGFIFFGMAIGLGIAALMGLLKDSIKSFSPTIQKSVFGLSSLLLLLPIVPLSANYFINDRSRNYMPYDYASNLLKPCEKDAIFITNGDNDTFPVWCLQEAYGIRTDVQTVNLSLANAPWYIKQLREKGLPVKWSDAEIDYLRPYQNRDGSVQRLQDQVVDEVITRNNGRRPIYISVTTPGENRRYRGKTLDSNVVLEGMVYRYTAETTALNQIDYPKTRRMFEEEFEFRGVADSTVFKDEATVRLVNNYSQGILWMADTLRRAGDFGGAFERIRKALTFLPNSHELYGYGTQLLADMGRFDTLGEFIERARTTRKAELYLQWGYSAKAQGNTSEALRIFKLVNNLYPDSEEAFRTLAATYYREQNIMELRKLLTAWLERHPDDNDAKSALSEIQKFEKSADSAGVN